MVPPAAQRTQQDSCTHSSHFPGRPLLFIPNPGTECLQNQESSAANSQREEAVCRTTFARIQNIIAQHAPTATPHIGDATEPPAQRCPCSCSCPMLHAHAAVTSCPNDHSYLVDAQHTCERTPTSPPVPRPAQPTALPRAPEVPDFGVFGSFLFFTPLFKYCVSKIGQGVPW